MESALSDVLQYLRDAQALLIAKGPATCETVASVLDRISAAFRAAGGLIEGYGGEGGAAFAPGGLPEDAGGRLRLAELKSLKADLTPLCQAAPHDGAAADTGPSDALNPATRAWLASIIVKLLGGLLSRFGAA